MTREANRSHNKRELDKYPAVKTAVMALAPHGGDLMTKFTINCAAQAGDDDPRERASWLHVTTAAARTHFFLFSTETCKNDPIAKDCLDLSS